MSAAIETPEKLELRFGYRIPENAKAAWGARYIYTFKLVPAKKGSRERDKFSYNVERLYDRCDCVGEPEWRRKLLVALNTKEFEDDLEKRLQAGFFQPLESSEESGYIFKVEKGLGTIGVLANPRGSHGYLYFTTYITEEGASPE